MNIVSNHNRLLRGAAIPTAGGDVYNSGWEYTPEGEISGYSGSAIYTGPDCSCDSAAIVDSAFDKSTAWVKEQNYLTAHQDVTNLPYVQNSSLEFNGTLISGISGSGFYAVSAYSASESERAISATVSQEAVHAGSADFVATANFANSASSALNAEISNVSYTALTANFLDGGWELDESGNITAYNNSAFAGSNGVQYEGISPIVVNNGEMKISAESARLGVQDPLYFVEDSNTATIIGIHDSAFPTFEGTEDGKISAINGSAINAASVTEYSAGNNIDITNHVISVTGSVPSADRAAYAVSATSAHFSHSAIEADSANYATESNHSNSSNSATYDSLGRKIVDTYLTAHQELPDWTPTIQKASGNAYNSAVNWVIDQHYLTAVTGDNTPYSAGANIDITNYVVSGKDWTNDIAAAANSAYTAATAQIPDVSDLPYVQNSALEFNGTLISGISGSGFYATSADTCRSVSNSAGWDITPYSAGSNIDITNHVVSGKDWTNDITAASSYAYNQATALIPTAEGKSYNVVAGTNVSVSTATASTGSTFTVSSKNWSANISNASSYAYNQSTAYTTSYVNGQLPSTIPLQAGPNVKLYMSANKVTISAGEFTAWDYYSNGLSYITANNVGAAGFKFNPNNLFDSYTLQQWTYNETRLGVNVYAVKFGATLNDVIGTQWSNHTGVFTLSKGNIMEINEFNCGDGRNNTQISILHANSWSNSVDAILRDIRNASTADNNTFTLYYTAIVGT